jgi:hypothetical protein
MDNYFVYKTTALGIFGAGFVGAEVWFVLGSALVVRMGCLYWCISKQSNGMRNVFPERP